MMWSIIDFGVLGVLDGGFGLLLEELRVSMAMVASFLSFDFFSMGKFDGLQLAALNFPDGVGNNSARFRTLPSCLKNS